MLEELQQTKARLKSKSKDKAIRQLIEYIPNRLADAYRFASTVHFLRWEASRDVGELQQAISCEKKYTKLKPNDDLRFVLINAIAHFVLARNIDAAMKCINKCRAKHIAVPAWKYSAAFLAAYQNNLDEAKQYYDSAISTEPGFEIPFQVEGFIAWILDIEPQMKQLNFCLGYINEKTKSDPVSASQYYTRFINSHPTEINSKCAIEHAQLFFAGEEQEKGSHRSQ